MTFLEDVELWIRVQLCRLLCQCDGVAQQLKIKVVVLPDGQADDVGGSFSSHISHQCAVVAVA